LAETWKNTNILALFTYFMRIISGTLGLLRDWIRFAAFTLLLFLLIRAFVVEAFTIPTASMEGTLLVGDFLFVNKALYGAEVPGTEVRLPSIREPERGDIVVFSPPHDRARVYVKRVIGVSGDTLAMRKKTLILNGMEKEEGYVRFLDRGGDAIHPGMKWQSDFLAAAGRPRRYSPSRDNWGPIVVPEGKFFVMGDNRDNSEDSRYWGFIDREDIKGQPWMVYLSLKGEEEIPRGWLERVRWDRVGRLVR
jgi:signal peptidase I